MPESSPELSPIPSARPGIIGLIAAAAVATIAGIALAVVASQPWYVALGLAFAAVLSGLAYGLSRLVAIVRWLRATEVPAPQFWDEKSVAAVLAKSNNPDVWDAASVAHVLARLDSPGVWNEKSVEQVLKRVGTDTRGIESRLRRSTARDVSALLALNSIVTAATEIPSPGGWAATPQTLLALVDMVSSLPANSVIVECGSGTSSVWLGLAVKQQNRGLRVIALDHLPEYFSTTEQALHRAGVDDVVEVRLAPLEPQDVDGGSFDWYAPSAVESLERISLLFVDGPPASSGKDARYPAFPLLRAKLLDGATVVLDDTNRKVESDIVEKWLQSSDGPGRLEHERDLDRSSIFRFSLSGTPSRG